MNAPHSRIKAVAQCPLTEIDYRSWLIGQALNVPGIFSTLEARVEYAIQMADVAIRRLAAEPPAWTRTTAGTSQGDAVLDLDALDAEQEDSEP